MVKTINYIKQRFVSATLEETAEKIRSAQNVVIKDWNLFQSGELQEYTKGHFSVNRLGEGSKLSMRYVKYMRFLDMKNPQRKQASPRRQGYHLYNRINFGTIYNYTVPTIKDGFTQEVREEWYNRIATAMGISVSDLKGQMGKEMRHKKLKLS